MVRRFSALCAMAAVVLLTSAAPGHAQINPFRSNSHPNGLTKADLAKLSEATGHLNTKDPLQAGDSEDWSNPVSGNGGKVSAVRSFHSSGMACHALKYDFAFKDQRPDQSYTLNWCKTSAGAWKIKS